MTELTPDGSGLVYSTYIGGSGNDDGYGIAVDGAGRAYVTGATGPDFPTTPDAFQTTNRGGDAFVTVFTPDGANLVYSTYLGGTSSDYGTGIAVAPDGRAFVTGDTTSTDFPITRGAFQSRPAAAWVASGRIS